MVVKACWLPWVDPFPRLCRLVHLQRLAASGPAQVFRRVRNDVHEQTQLGPDVEVRRRSGHHVGQSEGGRALQSSHGCAPSRYGVFDVWLGPCVLVCRIGSVLKQWRENVRRAFYPDPSLSSRGWVLISADHWTQSTCLSFHYSTSPEVQSLRLSLHHQQKRYGGWMATTSSSLSTYSNTPSWDQVCVKYCISMRYLYY